MVVSTRGKSAVDEMQVIIIGAGGHGSELYSYLHDMAEREQRVRLVGFVDEEKPRGPWGKSHILGNFEDLSVFLRLHCDTVFHYITAVGDNRVRRQLVQKVESLSMQNLVPWTLHHPHTMIGHDV